MNEPKFIVLAALDEPHGIAETGGYATAGMVAAPSVKTIIENIAGLYGILPGDWNGGLPPLEIASTPVPTTAQMPHYVPATARSRAAERKALPAKVGGQTAAAPGVRSVAVE